MVTQPFTVPPYGMPTSNLPADKGVSKYKELWRVGKIFRNNKSLRMFVIPEFEVYHIATTILNCVRFNSNGEIMC